MSFAKTTLAAVLLALAPVAAATLRQAPTTRDARGNRPPTVKLTASPSMVALAMSAEDKGTTPPCLASSPPIRLSSDASDPDGDALRYAYSTTGGKISGDGPAATLDINGIAPGVYTVTVRVDDGRGGTNADTATIEVSYCGCGLPIPIPTPCPTVVVSCPDDLGQGSRVTFTAKVTGGDPNVTPTFDWKVSAGAITAGQGTSSITIDTTGVSGTVTATVDVGGYDRSCLTSNSCTLSPGLAPMSRKVDEYGSITVGDEKARLDNFVIELQNDPTAQGYLLCYGGRGGQRGEGPRRCRRAREYMVTTRGIDAERLVAVDGGFREVLTVELWVVPSGATPPQAAPTFSPGKPRPRAAASSRGRRRH
jgi:hypothetical protein